MSGLAQDLDVSLRWVWLTVSFAILLILASPFVLGPERVARLTPVCESKARYGMPCSFCGMTTAFLAISAGHWEDAARSNRGAIPLYFLFLVNEVCILVFLRRGGLTCKFSV